MPSSNQPSRKGKKAWRKNVDVEDIESGLESRRDKERLIGDEDFVIDNAPDSSVKEKKLKSTEILTNKSKVAPLVNIRTKSSSNRIQGVSKTDLLKLINLNGGKYKLNSKAKARIDNDGLINVTSKDLWGAAPVDPRPDELKNASSSDYTHPSKIPLTLQEAPLSIIENDLTKKIIHAGKSYNPSLQSWKELIEKEYTIESKRELTRQQLKEHKERIQFIVDTINGNDFESDEEVENQEDEKVELGDESNSLSINKPTVVKIKTKSKRNALAKHKKRLELEKEVKFLKNQIRELSNLDNILSEQLAEKPVRNKRVRNKVFKYDALIQPLEVKLSDELNSNLKNVKPEGNLLYDTMLNLQSTGKIEARIPVAKRRRYTPKITEKWTSKDFK